MQRGEKDTTVCAMSLHHLALQARNRLSYGRVHEREREREGLFNLL